MSKTIRDLIDEGVISMDTKVLGAFLFTDDGLIVGEGSRVYFWNVNRMTDEPFICEWDVSGAGDHIPVENFYSSRESAAAARKAGA